MSIFGSFWKKNSGGSRKTIHLGRWQVGERIQNRYEIYQILGGEGKSGMGIVYICYDDLSKEAVALKTFQERFFSTQKVMDDFRKEALIWIKLDRHKNIVKAKYVEEIEERLYIAMEYVAGGNLDNWIGTKMLDLPLALNFAIQFCNGMEYAYKKLGLIHRDVKPSNILITEDKIIKITDFGLAKVVQEMIKEIYAVPPERMKLMQSSVAGTPPWMAPEQWTKGEIDTRTDIYSFGIILYQMITGSYPYPIRGNWRQIHFKESPFPIKQKVPDELNYLVFKCLEKDPKGRYQSFSNLKENLHEIYQRFTGEELALDVSPVELDAGELVDKSASLIELERYQEAIACSDKTINMVSERDFHILSAAWVNKGKALSKLGYRSDAIVCYDKAIKANPDFSLAWNNKGNALKNLGKYKEAIEHFNRALRLDPKFAAAWRNKGFVFGELGEHEKEVSCCDKALDINQRDDTAWHNKSLALTMMKKYQQALDCINKALEIKPDDAEHWVQEGFIYGEMGKHEDEIYYCKRAVEIAPKYVKAWLNMSRALANLDRFEEAIVCYDKVIEIDNSHGRAWLNKAGLLFCVRRFREAVKCCESLLAMLNDTSQANKIMWDLKAVFTDISEVLCSIQELKEQCLKELRNNGGKF